MILAYSSTKSMVTRIAFSGLLVYIVSNENTTSLVKNNIGMEPHNEVLILKFPDIIQNSNFTKG